jgi:TPR repeat protein
MNAPESLHDFSAAVLPEQAGSRVSANGNAAPLGCPVAPDHGYLGHAADAAIVPPLPEDILRAVFLQALTGKATGMPPGATANILRQALTLDAAVSASIFAEAKARAALIANPAPPDGPPPAAPSPAAPSPAAPTPAAAPRTILAAPTAAVRRRTGFIVAGITLALLAAAGMAIMVTRPAPAISKLFAAAARNPSAYATLLARAQGGDKEAEFAIGALLDRRFTLNEHVVPKNDAQAFEWYAQAAIGGFPPAEQSLGYAYLNGHGTQRDPIQAAHWYTLAAAQGLPNAQNALGFMYLSGIGVAQDNLHAAQWFAKAAAQNLPLAENNLANAYETGSGVTQNYGQAALWFARAAMQGEPNAQNSLGYLYYTGLGVARDYAKSARLFAAAASAGIPAADVNLGLSYATGNGVPKNPVTAATWCYRAAAAGAPNAAAALALITPQLTPAQLTAAKAAASVRPGSK